MPISQTHDTAVDFQRRLRRETSELERTTKKERARFAGFAIALLILGMAALVVALAYPYLR